MARISRTANRRISLAPGDILGISKDATELSINAIEELQFWSVMECIAFESTNRLEPGLSASIPNQEEARSWLRIKYNIYGTRSSEVVRNF